MTRTLRLSSPAGCDPRSFYPACYTLEGSGGGSDDDAEGFIQHFLLQSAVCILRQFEAWSVPRPLLELALLAAESYIEERHHEDLECDEHRFSNNRAIMKRGYTSVAPGEITLVEGESVTVLDSTGSCWCVQTAKGEVGMVPSNMFGPLECTISSKRVSLAEWHALSQFCYDKLGDGFNVIPFDTVPIPPPPEKRLSTVSSVEIDEYGFPHSSTGSQSRRSLYSQTFINDMLAGATLLATLVSDHELSDDLVSVMNDGSGGDERSEDKGPVADRISSALAALEVIDPQYQTSGARNVWVAKPAALSRGRGIFCENRLDLILKRVAESQAAWVERVPRRGGEDKTPSNIEVVGEGVDKWVIQKYIERPFLIHNTKFDIRQYFMITSWNPLSLFVYKDSYLRFSSSEFSLMDLRSDRSKFVHLCNQSVQKDSDESQRQKGWNESLMWTSDQLRKHLMSEGHESAWDEVIYPGMKECILASCLSCQPFPSDRRNSFELFGADFMLGEDLKPWLIEINKSPDLTPSSSAATATLVPSVLEDLLKVVVDAKACLGPVPKGTDLGRFELVVRHREVNVPNHSRLELQGMMLQGKKMPLKGLPSLRRHESQKPGI